MGDLRTSLTLNLTGNLTSQGQKYLSSLQRLGTGGSRAMSGLSRSVQAVSSGLDRMGNRYTALLTGAAGLGAIKSVGDLSQRLTYLGIQAGASSEEIDKLYAAILNTSQAPDIRVDPSEMLAGIEVIIEKLGDLDLAKGSLRNIGLVMRATGAEGKEVGDMVANLKEKFNLKSDDEIFQALDLLVNQGKAGAFTLKDMVTQGNRVTAAYGSMGAKGMEAVRQMGAVLQVFRKSTGSAEETSTSFKNLFADLMEKSDELKKVGISIWDPEALKKGRKEIKPIADLIFEIIQKAKGDPEKLGKIFGMQTMDGLKAAISEYIKTGKNPFDAFMDVQFDGKTLLADSTRAAKEFNAAIENLQTSWHRFAKTNLAGPVQQLADALNSVGEDTVQRWLDIGKNIALVGAGLIAANKGIKAVSWLTGLFGKGGKAAGDVLGKAGAGGLPVMVTNWPAGFGRDPRSIGKPQIPGGQSLPGAAGGAAASAAASGAAVAGVVLGTGAVVAGAAVASEAIAKAVSKSQVKMYETQKLREMLNDTRTGGPTTYQGKLIQEELARRDVEIARQIEVGGTIKLHIDSEGRPKVTELRSKNQDVKLDVDSGLMMVAP